MTSEQRLDRVERILVLFVNAGRRERQKSREQNEKINILIQTQMETSESINRLGERVDRTSETVDRLGERVDRTSDTVDRLGERGDRTSETVDRLAVDRAAAHAIHEKEMAELRRSQKLTDQALRAFIKSLHKRRNDKSSN